MSGTDYVFDKFHRTCDICGRPCKASELRVTGNVWICNRHRGYRTAKELDKLNARKRIPIAPLKKGTAPLVLRQTWEAQEARIFDLIVTVAPYETFDTTSDGAPGVTGAKSYQAAGWAAIYLYHLVTEGKRPGKWIERAKAKLAELADYFVANQTVSLPARAEHGAFVADVSENYLSEDLGVGAIALIRAYQVIGAAKYLTAARLCANAIVNFLAMETNQHNFPALVQRYSVVRNWNSNTQNSDNQFYPNALTCMWALKLLVDVDGDASYGATSGGDYAVSPARLASVARDQIYAFWATGVADAGTAAVITGLSATTPRENFDGTTKVWMTLGGNIRSVDWAIGLRCMYEVAGATAQLTACIAYMQGLAQNPVTRVPAGYSAKRIQTTLFGDWDPLVAPSYIWNPTTGRESGGLYELSAAGLLAPLVSAASLEAFKDAIAEPRPRTLEGSSRDGRFGYLGRLGRCGYSFQPFAPALTQRFESVSRAARVGLAYRVNPVGMGAHS